MIISFARVAAILRNFSKKSFRKGSYTLASLRLRRWQLHRPSSFHFAPELSLVEANLVHNNDTQHSTRKMEIVYKKASFANIKQAARTNRTLLVLTVLAANLVILLLRKNLLQNNNQPEGKSQKYHSHEQQQTGETEEKFSWSNEYKLWTLSKHSEALQSQLMVFPESSPSSSSDRVIDQLLMTQETDIIFKIKPSSDQHHLLGQEPFRYCPVNKCQITHDKDEADGLVFLNSDVIEEPQSSRRADQVWIAYLLESPLNTYDKRFVRSKRGRHEFNWTASYRSDSDIVTQYSKFVPYSNQAQDFIKLKTIKTIKDRKSLALFEDYFKPKKVGAGKVAWLVSNCNAANKRLEYAKELSHHFQVDIYGKCGNLTCQKWNETGCFDMINENYKFYLSFENSNCRQYITEKLFKNALGYNDAKYQVVPIVMGASRKDYEELAPPASFIHVEDFDSPKDLANYLKLLDQDDQLYRSYFHWKKVGKFIDTKFMCRLCAMLHFSHKHQVKKSYVDIKSWWLSYGDSQNSNESCES